MKSITGKQLARELERRGWALKRISGSHHIYAKAGHPARLSIPIHGNATLKTGLLHHLLKTADMTEDDL